MDGVVLAAGEGTRMRPLTADRPKGLVTVAGRRLLSHCFDTLLSVGIERLVVVVGYRGDDIVDYYGDAYEGTPIEYVRQDERLGLAHALRQALPAVEGTFVAMNGDNVCRADLAAVLDRHRETDAAATLLVERVSRAQAKETGVVETGPDGRVTGLVEKPDDPPSTLVSRGFYVFGPAIDPACRLVTPSARGEYELPAAIDLLCTAGHRVEAVELDGWCHNVNEPADRTHVEGRLD
ncbi:sugar phosphate nucleotidyltransferase [Halomicroarcula sp. GCM10025324]|uniref:nucleotidyltransferase family protein n=1 Tax=Haloarcula TaxID=2237 RepID=UPI0023E8C54E|nr:nucleotidyltransferase family protein [Halomicroarcula sp. ZS-22-S1]